jgi:RecJ-like exonuclease
MKPCGCSITLCPTCDGAGSRQVKGGVVTCEHCQGRQFIHNDSCCRLPEIMRQVEERLSKARVILRVCDLHTTRGHIEMLEWFLLLLRGEE